MERAGVMGDEEVGRVKQSDSLRQGKFANDVDYGEIGKEGADVGVVRAADEYNLASSLKQKLCEFDVVLGGPAAEGGICQHVARTGGRQDNARAGGGRQGRDGKEQRGQRGKMGGAKLVRKVEEDAGKLIGVVAPGEDAAIAARVREHELARCANGEREDCVAVVVVEGGDDLVGAAGEHTPELEDGGGTNGERSEEDSAIVGQDGIYPGVKLQDREDGRPTYPVNVHPRKMKLMSRGKKHSRVADGTEFDQKNTRHACGKNTLRAGHEEHSGRQYQGPLLCEGMTH